MAELNTPPRVPYTTLLLEAAVAGGFVVFDPDFSIQTSAGHRRPSMLFAGSIDQCLDYMRQKMGPEPEPSRAAEVIASVVKGLTGVAERGQTRDDPGLPEGAEF